MLVLVTGACCILRESPPGEFTSDFILRESFPGECTSDFILREKSPGEFTNDFILRESSPGELISDSILREKSPGESLRPIVRLQPGPIPPNWSTESKGDFSGKLQWTAYKGAKVFGPFGNQQVTLVVTGIVPHDSVTVALELVTLGSWDGAKDHDSWSCILDGDTLITTTFSTTTFRQNYPDTTGGKLYPARSGAMANNSVGFRFTEPGIYDGTLDACYRLEFRRAHTDRTLTITMIGSLRDVHPNLRNEAWGLRSFDVSIHSVQRPAFDAPTTPDIVPGR
ncbi:MAG TPA: hypothetical protein DIS79_04160 [Bacteroidetes bacterium]|nr:hypothetical protein [Bacteroidota bacterium]HRK06073.1 hypothetical protein [Chlorobiota bacterium]